MPDGSIRYWVQNPMMRIFPHDTVPKRAKKNIVLYAAGGETESFIIGFRTYGYSVNCIEAEASALKGKGRNRIGKEHITILYPEYVPVKWNTAKQSEGDIERKAPGFFPDPLMKEWIFPVAGPESPPVRSIWVQVKVPEHTSPGIYRGKVRFKAIRKPHTFENEIQYSHVQCSGEVEFQVRVWDFRIPSRPNIFVTNWFFPDQIATWYSRELWSASFWKLMERFCDDMAEHRQNVFLTKYLGGEKAADQMVGVKRQGKKYSFDFTLFDRWCRMFFRKGFKLIEGGHIAARSQNGLSYWEVDSTGKAKLRRLNAHGSEFRSFLKQFICSLWSHLEKRGWQNRYVQHISDEPLSDQVEKYSRLARLVKRAAPGIRIIDAVGKPEYASLIDYPVPIERHYQAFVDAGIRSPEDIWVYYCCGPQGPWPNRFIDYLLIRLRIIFWICFQKGIPGFLHWGYNYWKGGAHKTYKDVLNPWDDNTANRWPAGDPFMVYPPRDIMMKDQITSSIRWEIFRKSLEDYEYLMMTRELSDSGDREAQKILEDVSDKVVPDWTTHTRDHRLLESIRLRIGRLLQKQRS